MDRFGGRCTGAGVKWWRELLRPCWPRSLIDLGERGEGRRSTPPRPLPPSSTHGELPLRAAP